MFDFNDLNNRFHIIIATTMVAKVQRAYYESLVEEGFEEDFALHLVELLTGVAVSAMGTAIPQILNGYNDREQ